MRNRSLKKALRLASKAVKLQKKWLALNGLIAAVLSKGDCLADKRGLGVVEVDAETIDQLFGSIAGGSPARVFLATDFAELKSFLKITYSGPNTALDAAGRQHELCRVLPLSG